MTIGAESLIGLCGIYQSGTVHQAEVAPVKTEFIPMDIESQKKVIFFLLSSNLEKDNSETSFYSRTHAKMH